MSKNIDEAKTCSVCGTALSGVDESCPVCMLREGLSGGVESGESSTFEDTVRPTPEQTVKRFEHYELVTGEDGTPVELGRGAMGVTYKAFDVDLRCPVESPISGLHPVQGCGSVSISANSWLAACVIRCC